MIDRITIIQKIINQKKASIYLEIGVHTGACFLNINAPRKIAVDPKILLKKKKKFKNKYYEMTSDEFFEKEQKILTKYGLDVVFLDGLHTHEQSLKDVLNSLKYLNEKGVIVMHDCNPQSETIAFPANSIKHAKSLNLPGWEGKWSGDVWKTIILLKSNCDDLNIFVLDYDYGLGIITKGKQKNPLKYSPEEIRNLSYNDLEKNREKLLNLKSIQYFNKFIAKL